MTELIGNIKDFNIDFRSNKANIIFELVSKTEGISLYEKYKADEKLDIKISKHREKRSVNSNDYCWQLCSKLAEALSNEKVRYTKDDIYRKAIKETGIYKDFRDLSSADAKTLRAAWEMLGTGWITEQVDYMPDGENVIVRCYYGSSKYNKKQMGRLIDGIVQDCKAVGIETKTPNEIAEMLSRWEAAK